MPTWPSRIKICAKIDLALSFKLLCWGKPVFSVWFKTANHWKSGLLIIELRLKLFTTYSTQNNILFYTNLLLNASPVFIWARSPLHFQKYSTDSICSFFLKGSAILSLHAFFFDLVGPGEILTESIVFFGNLWSETTIEVGRRKTYGILKNYVCYLKIYKLTVLGWNIKKGWKKSSLQL